MAFESISPNMNLVLPGVGQTDGPQYATDQNASFTLIDQHDHSSGKGVPITPAGLNISADLNFRNNNATGLRSSRYIAQTSLALPADLNAVYVSGVDLYYIDGNGNNVRLTQSGNVAGTSGSIANLVSPASATYVGSPSFTFVWQSNTSTPANMDFGSAVFRNVTASSNGITMSAPAALASNYTLTLPSLPPSQRIMTLDASGNIAAPYTVDSTSIRIVSNVLKLGLTPNIVASQISATANIAGTQLAANANIQESQLQQLASSVASVTTFSTTNASFTAVTNAVASVVGIGRPVLIQFQCTTGTAGDGYIGVVTGQNNRGSFRIRNATDGTTIHTGTILYNNTSGGSVYELRLPLSTMNCIDVSQPVGGKQYQLEVSAGGGTTITINNCIMSATAI